MKRTSLAVIAAVAALAAYGSNAQACISCDYVPEVLKSGEAGSTYRARPSKRVRDYSEQREKRASKKRVTTRESAPEKSAPARASKADEPAKSTASVAPAVTEQSAITTKGTSIANQVKASIVPVQTGPQTENSTISEAVKESSAKPDTAHPVEHVAADKTVGCKKYFPSTGLTLSVPCE